MNESAKPSYILKNKFDLVGEFVLSRSGSLLDLGARDRALSRHISLSSIEYKSHDLVPGHDYQFDLEMPIPLAERSFEYVVALDVLEHVEHIHDAFAEMMRIASSYVIITLPVINNLNSRLRFMFTSELGTKYWLLPEHQGDRHRWLTTYAQIRRFVDANALKRGFKVERIINHVEHFPLPIIGLPLYALARAAALVNWQANGLFTRSLTIFLRRES